MFPTAGANYPTITIAALTLRLSGHLYQQLKYPDTGFSVPDLSAQNSHAVNEPVKNRYASASPLLAGYPGRKIIPDRE